MYDAKRMDEVLIPSSGKMVLLDKLLPKLKREGHKVCYGDYAFLSSFLHLIFLFSMLISLSIFVSSSVSFYSSFLSINLIIPFSFIVLLLVNPYFITLSFFSPLLRSHLITFLLLPHLLFSISLLPFTSSTILGSDLFSDG